MIIKSYHSECLLFASPCENVCHLCYYAQPSKSTGMSILELRKLRHNEAHAVTFPGSHSLFRDGARVGLCPVVGPRMQVLGQRADGQADGDTAAPTSHVGSILAKSGTSEPQLSCRLWGQALTQVLLKPQELGGAWGWARGQPACWGEAACQLMTTTSCGQWFLPRTEKALVSDHLCSVGLFHSVRRGCHLAVGSGKALQGSVRPCPLLPGVDVVLNHVNE